MARRTLGERLREARGDKAIEDVAHDYRVAYGKERGVSRATISRWENDDGRPQGVVLARLALVLGVPLSELDPDTYDEIVRLAGPWEPGEGAAGGTDTKRYRQNGTHRHERAAA
jgi:transcriptional regulator with XRE-family HTH domain